MIERPAAYQVSYGVVEGRAARGAKRVIVRVDGAIARKLRLTAREFRLEVDLPPREVRVRVETVDAAGRRAGRTVRNVFGLPRAARPHVRFDPIPRCSGTFAASPAASVARPRRTWRISVRARAPRGTHARRFPRLRR